MRATVAALSLLLLPAVCSAGMFTSTDVPKEIPSLGTIYSTITVPYGVTIADVNVLIASLDHTYIEDLRISLTSPFGTNVMLFSNHGESGDNLVNTLFDDEALVPIAAGAAPFTGVFRPVGSLSSFDGENSVGVWTLTIADVVEWDSGRLNAWSLEINGAQGAVPEPATLLLGALALLLLPAARLRKRSGRATVRR